jgi:hypothetical protein
VSILIASCLMVGRWRGTQPARERLDDQHALVALDALAPNPDRVVELFASDRHDRLRVASAGLDGD